ncbi:hypothetical protein ACHAXT_008927 [Thalassiosira profunda]
MATSTNGGAANGSSQPAAAKPQQSSSGGLSYKAILFMSLLALQFGVQPIVTQRFTSKAITKSTVIFMQEVTKLVIGATGMTLGKAKWSEVTAGWTVASWLRLALLPATIYLVQNLCSLLAYQNLDAITYNVLNQTKTLSAALCCYLLMGKRQSTLQMAALVLLLTAALVMEKVLPMDALLPSYWMGGERTDNASTNVMPSLSPRHFSHGVLPILVASFLSGLAGATTQKSLQVGNRHALLFTIELCVASLLLLLAAFATSEDGRKIRERGFFDEWTVYTLVPIVTNAAGGILVGLVIKHAGTVRKGFALIFGILISGVFQSALDESKSISKEEIAGGVLAAISLWMHATNPYVKPISEDTTAATTASSRPRRKARKED